MGANEEAKGKNKQIKKTNNNIYYRRNFSNRFCSENKFYSNFQGKIYEEIIKNERNNEEKKPRIRAQRSTPGSFS